MDKMTTREKRLLRELQEKDKKIKKQMTKFWRDVDEHKEEILERFGVEKTDTSITMIYNQLVKIAGMYEMSVGELLQYVSSEKQINYYHNYVKR
ncbi:MAG: hypothetical protein Q4E53_11795 [Eubacteriales bacterium]|nr:hypothetical protein [Eubacteriales bacterium]